MNASQRFVLYVLQTGEWTAAALSGITGISEKSVRAALDGLRSDGSAHICAWQKGTSGQHTAIWAAGQGMDEPKPQSVATTHKSPPIRREQVLAMQMREAGVDMSSPFSVAMWQVAR